MGMEDVAKELVSISPITAAMLVIVWMFLKALASRDVVIKSIAKSFAATSTEQVKEIKNLREVLGANMKVVEANTKVLNQVVERLG